MKPKPQSFFNPSTSFASSLSLDKINFPALGSHKNSSTKPNSSKSSQLKRPRVEDANPDVNQVTKVPVPPVDYQSKSQKAQTNKTIQPSNVKKAVQEPLTGASIPDPDTEMLPASKSNLHPNEVAEEVIIDFTTSPIANKNLNLSQHSHCTSPRQKNTLSMNQNECN